MVINNKSLLKGEIYIFRYPQSQPAEHFQAFSIIFSTIIIFCFPSRIAIMALTGEMAQREKTAAPVLFNKEEIRKELPLIVHNTIYIPIY